MRWNVQKCVFGPPQTEIFEVQRGSSDYIIPVVFSARLEQGEGYSQGIRQMERGTRYWCKWAPRRRIVVDCCSWYSVLFTDSLWMYIHRFWMNETGVYYNVIATGFLMVLKPTQTRFFLVAGCCNETLFQCQRSPCGWSKDVPMSLNTC